MPATQFSLESARDLSGHVSRRIPATTVIMNNNDGDGSEGDEDEMFYEKIIVIKVCQALRTDCSFWIGSFYLDVEAPLEIFMSKHRHLLQ